MPAKWIRTTRSIPAVSLVFSKLSRPLCITECADAEEVSRYLSKLYYRRRITLQRKKLRLQVRYLSHSFWTILNFNEFYRAPTPKAAESPQACGRCLSATSPSAIGDCRAEAYVPAYPGTKTRRHEVAPKPDPKPPGFRPAAGFSRRSAPGFSFPGYDRIRKRFSVFGNLRGADAQFGRPGTPALNVPTAIPADQSHPFPNAVFEPGNKKLIVTVVFHGIRSQAGGRCDRDEPRQPSRFFIH